MGLHFVIHKKAYLYFMHKTLFPLFLLLGIITLSSPDAAFAATIATFPSVPETGDTIVATLKSDASVVSSTFGGEKMSFYRYRNASLTFLPLAVTKTPGRYWLRAALSDGSRIDRLLTIQQRKFPTIVLPLPEGSTFTPTTYVQQLTDTKQTITKLTEATSTPFALTRSFGLPLYDNRRLASTFGEIRKTGEEMIRHMGVDLGAKRGSSVVAINDGVVIKSYMDSVYGNSVIIDHGGNIVSLSLHLTERLVKEGDKVKRGCMIGTVGSSGVSTAPHLHLSIRIQGVSIDPIRFVNAFQAADCASQ